MVGSLVLPVGNADLQSRKSNARLMTHVAACRLIERDISCLDFDLEHITIRSKLPYKFTLWNTRIQIACYLISHTGSLKNKINKHESMNLQK